MKNAEHNAQVEVFQWCAYHRRKYPELDLLYAVPNAGARTPRQGAWLKAEGLKRGVPDMVLPVARHGFNSLYIELKIGKNKATPDQLLWKAKLREHNNLSIVCVGSMAVIRQLEDYLS